MSTTAFVEYAQQLADSGLEPGAIVAALKKAGARQLQTVFALRKVLDCALPEADNLVLNHPAWTEHLEDILQYRNQVWDALEQAADQVEYSSDGQLKLTWNLSEEE
ncbi:hypothetical protein [Hymenobacter koreensis]|uniref:Uncharacterized protein n=1 Tax=Hymenobacter koreensis TaxID=1084523 RepID=A0ABP8IZD5_9BACT